MKCSYRAAAAAALVLLTGSQLVHATVLFSYEPGEEDLPMTGNAAASYSVTTETTTGVTSGSYALQVSSVHNTFGGALSPAFTDPTTATLIDNASTLYLDVTLPAVQLSYGNIDIHLEQSDASDPLGGDEEISFNSDNLGAYAPGTTHTIAMSTQLQADPGVAAYINPTEPWAYQIDFSYGPSPAAGSPQVWEIDSIRDTPAVPEPVSLGVVGAAGLLVARRRR